jgi:hypothetical protein
LKRSSSAASTPSAASLSSSPAAASALQSVAGGAACGVDGVDGVLPCRACFSAFVRGLRVVQGVSVVVFVVESAQALQASATTSILLPNLAPAIVGSAAALEAWARPEPAQWIDGPAKDRLASRTGLKGRAHRRRRATFLSEMGDAPTTRTPVCVLGLTPPSQS